MFLYINIFIISLHVWIQEWCWPESALLCSLTSVDLLSALQKLADRWWPSPPFVDTLGFFTRDIMSEGQDTVLFFATELLAVLSWRVLEVPSSRLFEVTGTLEGLWFASSKRSGIRSGGWEGLVTLSEVSDSVWLLPAFLRLPLFLLSGTVGSTNCVDWKANGSMSKEAMPINSASAAGWGGDIRAGTQEEEETVSFLWSLRLERESPVNLLSSSSSLKEIDKPSLVESGRSGRYIFDPPETKHQRSAYGWVTTVKQLAFKLY